MNHSYFTILILNIIMNCPWCKFFYEKEHIEKMVMHTIPFCINCSNSWPDTFLFQHLSSNFIAYTYLPRQVDLILKTDYELCDSLTLLIPLLKQHQALTICHEMYSKDKKYRTEIMENGVSEYFHSPLIHQKINNIKEKINRINILRCSTPCPGPCYGFMVYDLCNVCGRTDQNIPNGSCPSCGLLLTYQNVFDPTEQIFCHRCKNIFEGGTLNKDDGLIRNKDALNWFSENQISPISMNGVDRNLMINSLFYIRRWPHVFQQGNRLFHTILHNVLEFKFTPNPDQLYCLKQKQRVLDYIMGYITKDELRNRIKQDQMECFAYRLGYNLFMVLYYKMIDLVFYFYTTIQNYDNNEKINCTLLNFYSICEIQRQKFNINMDDAMRQYNISEYPSVSPFWTLRDKRKYDFSKYNLERYDNGTNLLNGNCYTLEDEVEYEIKDVVM